MKYFNSLFLTLLLVACNDKESLVYLESLPVENLLIKNNTGETMSLSTDLIAQVDSYTVNMTGLINVNKKPDTITKNKATNFINANSIYTPFTPIIKCVISGTYLVEIKQTRTDLIGTPVAGGIARSRIAIEKTDPVGPFFTYASNIAYGAFNSETGASGKYNIFNYPFSFRSDFLNGDEISFDLLIRNINQDIPAISYDIFLIKVNE